MSSACRNSALCVLLVACHAASAEDFVLLRNGNVMIGRAFYEGDRVRLERLGSEFWFEKTDVATIEPTLQLVYLWQRGQISAPTATDHLRLAAWCIDQELFAQASRELLDARTLSPRDPRTHALEQRLMQTAYPQPTQGQAATPRPPSPALTDEQIDELPPGTLEDFARHIQPLLVNNCTKSGCHQAGGDRRFQLNRDLLHGMADRRSTLANLASVLDAVDRDKPSDSPLLVAANEPHAGRSTAAFTGRHAPLGQKLEEWVLAIAASRVTPTTAEPQRQSSGVFGLVKAQRERDQIIQQASAQSEVTGVRDEFDPEVFNRRYRTARR